SQLNTVKAITLESNVSASSEMIDACAKGPRSMKTMGSVRPSGLGMIFLVGTVLIIGALGVSMLVSVECPCHQVVIRPPDDNPCELCDGTLGVPVLRSWSYLFGKGFR